MGCVGRCGYWRAGALPTGGTNGGGGTMRSSARFLAPDCTRRTYHINLFEQVTENIVSRPDADGGRKNDLATAATLVNTSYRQTGCDNYFVLGVTRQDVRWERRVSFRLLVAGESIRNRVPHRDRRSPGRHTGRGVGPKPCHGVNLVRRGPGERRPGNNRRLPTFSQGSPRRCWVSWSRSLENFFSCLSSFRRASSHWSLETTV